jgi:hypothetical protein
MDPAIPWYKSSIIVSGLTGDIAGEQQQQITNLLVTLAGGAGDLYALIGRMKQTHAPVVTGTAKKAAELIEQAQPVAAVAVPLDAEAEAVVPQSLGAAPDTFDAYGVLGQTAAAQQERK